MKKILVLAYLRNNLGDDLFVNELLKRYPNNMFYINTIDSSFAKPFEKHTNSVINIIKDETFNNIHFEDYDCCVYIGGSIFMEGGHVYNLDEGCFKFIHDGKLKNKPFFYISSNYGPYQTDNYFKLSQKTFNVCKDLCFRDMYSYKLFKDIPSVRYAPDAAFTYIPSNIPIKPNTVGISLIDLSIRDEFKNKEKEHIEFLHKNISSYLQQNKKIYLFSFCKHEGDENAIKKLYTTFTKDFQNENISVVKYINNIDKFLNIYQQMEYMICERFHSLVLSYLFKHNFFVISYSQKIDNIIEELNLCNNHLKFKDISNTSTIDLDNFNKVDKNNLQSIITNAQNQFSALDNFLTN